VKKDQYKVTYKDLKETIDLAKSNFLNTKIPMNLSDNIIYGEDVLKVLLLDSFLTVLNKNGLLTKEVKFDERS
jgi:hypothetical protein